LSIVCCNYYYYVIKGAVNGTVDYIRAVMSFSLVTITCRRSLLFVSRANSELSHYGLPWEPQECGRWVYQAWRDKYILVFFYFNIHRSVHRNNILVYKSQQDAHVTEFILSDNCSTCFGRHYHPSLRAQTTVTTKPLISVGHRHHTFVSKHMKTKTDQHATHTHSSQSQLFHDSSRQQYGMYVIHYSTEHIAFSSEYTLFNNNCNFNLIYRYSLSIYFSWKTSCMWDDNIKMDGW